jgi:hypothetical protein
MPAIKAFYENENCLDALAKINPERLVEISIWPEAPCYWAPRAGEGFGLLSAPLAQASVAGARVIQNATAEDPRSEECFWVSSSLPEWNYCFWNAADSSLSTAEACAPQVGSKLLEVQASSGMTHFRVDGHGVVSKNYPLPARSGHLRLWFVVQDTMTEAQIKLSLLGHVEQPL